MVIYSFAWPSCTAVRNHAVIWSYDLLNVRKLLVLSAWRFLLKYCFIFETCFLTVASVRKGSEWQYGLALSRLETFLRFFFFFRFSWATIGQNYAGYMDYIGKLCSIYRPHCQVHHLITWLISLSMKDLNISISLPSVFKTFLHPVY